MKNFLLSCVFLFAVVRCGQVDFPKDSLAPVKQPVDVSKYVLNFEEVMEFHEGEFAEYVIRASVPEGSAVVTVKDLPNGVTFNPETLRLSWRVPKGTVKGSPRPSSNGYSSFPIFISLRASGDPIDVVIRKAVLLVYEK